MANQAGYPFQWDGMNFNEWAGLTADQWEAKAGANCIPQSVYGPINHTLFLGCSISSFSCSVGWNEQQGQVTVQLVQDTCASSSGKIYWDADLQVRLLTTADPGFVGEAVDIIGSPVYFRVDNFEYCGIVQSWEKTNSESGNPTYSVTIVDPRQILQGAQIIIGEYGGSLGSKLTAPYNLFNVYGYMESLGSACSQTSLTGSDPVEVSDYTSIDGGYDGSMFGSEAGAFGGASVNDNGMPWNSIATGLNVLTSGRDITNAFSPHGRLLFKATNSTAGFGLLSGDRADSLITPFPSLPSPRWLAEYFLDISELPVAPQYWRLNGSSTPILDGISQLLTDAGYDYYLELIPVRGVSTSLAPSGIAKFIKIRTVKRLSQPATGKITTFIGNSEGTISTSNGLELRNEPTTSFLIGGKKNTYYQIEQDDRGTGDWEDDTIIPYFGLKSNGDAIIPVKVDPPLGDGIDRWEFTTDTGALENTLEVLAVPESNTITINELELQTAKSGFDSWISYVITMGTDTGTMLSDGAMGTMWDINGLVKLLGEGNITSGWKGYDWVNWKKENTFTGVAPDDVAVKVQEDAQALYSWVNGFATEFYGKKYQVLVPFTCVRQDGESNKILTTESPAQTGWTDRTTVLKLLRTDALYSYMTDEDGRVEAMMRFDDGNTLDVTGLNQDDFGTYGGDYYVRCQVESEYVYSDKSSHTNPRGVLTLPANIKLRNADAGAGDGFRGCNLLVKLIELKVAVAKQAAAKDNLSESLKNVGNKMAFAALDYPIQVPSAAGFGIQSNVLTYGPWTSAGPAGTVRVDHDSGLTPWEYGGVGTMNLAGNSKAAEGITHMQVSEKGSISVPGYPTIPMGAELGAYEGGFYGAGTNLVENRVTTLTGSIYTTEIGGWTGLYGPNVTDISVDIGDGGVQTTYNMRTYTPKFGRFAKGNAERLKTVGQGRLTAQRDASLARLKLGTRAAKKRFKEGVFAQVGNGELIQGVAFGHSPHEILVGSMSNFAPSGGDDVYKRVSVATTQALEVCLDTQNDYDKKAFMSMDGLIRPISMDGDGGLPQYAGINGACEVSNHRGIQPPVADGDGGTIYYNELLLQNHLNPFSNPVGLSRSQISTKTKNATTDYVGHDIDILGRHSTIPAGDNGGPTGLPMPIVGFNDTNGSDYYNDYRAFALRGPLVMQSWGYDLDGRPIPNRADDETDASGGTFVDEDLEGYFLPKWLRKPHTWPTAPIDLRFDRARGLWVSPPAYRLVYATMNETLCIGSSAKAIIDQSLSPDLDDLDGSAISDAYITVYDRTNSCIPSGHKVVAYYDPVLCQYSAIEGPSPSIWNSGCNDSVSSLVGHFNELILGTGLVATQLGCASDGSHEDNQRCRIKLSSNITVQGNKDCPTGVLGDKLPFDNLVFGSGFLVSGSVGDNCDIHVESCPAVGSGINLTGSDDCVSTGDQSAIGAWTNINIAKGLATSTTIGDDTTAKIGLSFSVRDSYGEVEGAAGIALGDCLKADPSGDCGVKISFATGIKPTGGGGKIWYVHNISCTGGTGIVVERRWIEFSNCGTYLGSGNPYVG